MLRATIQAQTLHGRLRVDGIGVGEVGHAEIDVKLA